MRPRPPDAESGADDERDLVVWRAKLTMRFAFMSWRPGATKISKEAALAKIKMERSPDAVGEEEEIGETGVRCGYELSPEHDPKGCSTLIGDLFTDHEWVLGSYQRDDEEAIGWARAVRASMHLKRG